jgi:hypothetical protein
MNDDEADTLYDLMPKTYRQRDARAVPHRLYHLIKPVVAGTNLPGPTGGAGQTLRSVLSLLRPKSPVFTKLRNGFTGLLTPLPVPALYLRPDKS